MHYHLQSDLTVTLCIQVTFNPSNMASNINSVVQPMNNSFTLSLNSEGRSKK